MQTTRTVGLDRRLIAAWEPWRPVNAVHGLARIVLDLAALASGRDCLADIAPLQQLLPRRTQSTSRRSTAGPSRSSVRVARSQACNAIDWSCSRPPAARAGNAEQRR